VAFRVALERAAVEGLADLKPEQQQIYKALKKLETSPELGEPLGRRGDINLTGCRKLVLANRRIRIIYRIEDDFVRVVVIGKREDLAVYRLAQDELRRLGLT
jgi:mRNA-degrading endonuclease RelE of RelBE toxin-antitoxin system